MLTLISYYFDKIQNRYADMLGDLVIRKVYGIRRYDNKLSSGGYGPLRRTSKDSADCLLIVSLLRLQNSIERRVYENNLGVFVRA